MATVSYQMDDVNEMVKNYEHGWETVLDSSFKKGVEPSGGQWQRIALARAFYRQAKILILDESTAAIDAKAEYNIFNNIFEHYKGKTTIIVSHRFSTVRRADRIIVLDHGKIVETGSHTQLLKKKASIKRCLRSKPKATANPLTPKSIQRLPILILRRGESLRPSGRRIGSQ